MGFPPLGRFIAEYRQKKGLSLRELGKQAGVSFSAIYKIENGLVKPETETLERLALAMDMRPDHLESMAHQRHPRGDRGRSGEVRFEDARLAVRMAIDDLPIEHRDRRLIWEVVDRLIDHAERRV